jgi:cell division control protein 6
VNILAHPLFKRTYSWVRFFVTLREKDNRVWRIISLRFDRVPQCRSVFKDETKLDMSYIPYKLPNREEKLRLLTEFFSSVQQFPGKMAQRVIITGDVGTGKTVLAQRFGTDITREANRRGTSLHYVHVNCREHRGSLFLIMHHVISLFHPNFPKRGYSAEELLHMLLQDLDEQNTCVILTLDEFDSLVEEEGSDAVYKLTRLQETRQGKPQRLSLVCILRNLKVIGRLDACTRSTLQSNIITLEKYSKPQLIDILSDRVILAFKPRTVPDDSLSLLAELAFSEGGNARFAIELLWRAGKYADAEESTTVPPECVRKAASSITPAMQKSELTPLNFHEKLFLLGIARLFKGNQDAYVSLMDAEGAYAVACEEFSVRTHSHTQLWKYLQTLLSLGIVKSEVSGTGSRGRSTIISLPAIPAYELEKELASLLEKREG